jgi:hypothetical protein
VSGNEATTKYAAFLGASQNHEIAYHIDVKLRDKRAAFVISAYSKKKSLAALVLGQSIGARVQPERLRLARKCYR